MVSFKEQNSQKKGITRLGLPILTEQTYNSFLEELGKIKSNEESITFLSRLFKKIRDQDGLYAKWIRDTTGMYPRELQSIAFSELVFGYEFLRRGGELPKIDPIKYQKRWDGTSDRSLSTLNVGLNLGIIRDDNPIFSCVITQRSAAYFSGEFIIHAISDLSSGYMYLVDNAKREKT
ncbi:MAG: hypothetical protein WC548_03790 [Candidatus Pacearchaeota archaeon]